MDEERRRELEQRRIAMNLRREQQAVARARQASADHVASFTAALMAAGEEFRLEFGIEDRAWMPEWLPCGWSRFVWEAAPRWRPLPGGKESLPERAAGIREALQTLGISEDTVVCYYEGLHPAITVRLSRAALQRNVQAALEVLRDGRTELWIADRYGEWIIRVEGRWSTLYLPEEPDEAAKKQKIEEELWAVAAHLVEEHGESAVAAAEEFIKSSLERHDQQGALFWHFVAERVEELLSTKRC